MNIVKHTFDIATSGIWSFLGVIIILGLICHFIIELIKSIGWCFRPKLNIEIKDKIEEIQSILSVYLPKGEDNIILSKTEANKLAEQINDFCNKIIRKL